MKANKKTSVGGEWAKKGVDFVSGDVVKVLNPGTIVSGDYGDRHVFSIQTKDGPKNQTFNQTSMNAGIDAYGDETDSWVDKDFRITIVKQNVSGKFVDVVYLAHPDWELGENGFYNPVADTQVKTEELPF
jgi:hypothetical protein